MNDPVNVRLLPSSRMIRRSLLQNLKPLDLSLKTQNLKYDSIVYMALNPHLQREGELQPGVARRAIQIGKKSFHS